MTFLPLIERELRVRSRQRVYYWSRVTTVFLGILFVVPTLSTDARIGGVSTGAMAFSTLTTFLFLLCSCAGALTANAIIEERREGTLGLLFLTRVNAFDVTVGALGSAGLTCLSLLVAFIPVIMLPILAGGVAGGEAVRKIGVLIATLYLSLAVGVWTASANRRRLNHPWMPLLVMAGLMCFLYVLSPAAAMLQAESSRYRSAPLLYWRAIATCVVLATALFIAASKRLRVSIKTGAESLPVEVDPKKVKPSRAKPFQPIPDGANPVQILIESERGNQAALWCAALFEILFSVSGLGLLMRWVFRYSGAGFVYTWWPMMMGSAVLQSAVFVWVASRGVLQMKKSGGLELLRTTPVGSTSIVTGHWAAMKRLMRWPVFLLMAPTLIWGAVSVATPLAVWPWPNNSYISYQIANLVLYPASIVLQSIALVWVAFWFGLTARTQAAAILYSVMVVKGVPYLIGQVVNTAAVRLWIMPVGSSAGPPLAYWVLHLSSSVIALCFYIAVWRWARRRVTLKLTGAEPSRRAPLHVAAPAILYGAQ
jgi:hypothetical protein